MDMTLDEALAEIDKWKSAAVDQVATLAPADRAKLGQEAIVWLEREIGRPLERVRVSDPKASATSGTCAATAVAAE